jgi:hypothetical protein
MLKIALCGSLAIYVILNAIYLCSLGHMVEHVSGLPDLILFLTNELFIF